MTLPMTRPERCEACSLGDTIEAEAEWGCDGGSGSFSRDDSRECVVAATLERAASKPAGRKVRSQPSSSTWRSPSLDAERDGNLEDGSAAATPVRGRCGGTLSVTNSPTEQFQRLDEKLVPV